MGGQSGTRTSGKRVMWRLPVLVMTMALAVRAGDSRIASPVQRGTESRVAAFQYPTRARHSRRTFDGSTTSREDCPSAGPSSE